MVKLDIICLILLLYYVLIWDFWVFLVFWGYCFLFLVLFWFIKCSCGGLGGKDIFVVLDWKLFGFGESYFFCFLEDLFNFK